MIHSLAKIVHPESDIRIMVETYINYGS